MAQTIFIEHAFDKDVSRHSAAVQLHLLSDKKKNKKDKITGYCTAEILASLMSKLIKDTNSNSKDKNLRSPVLGGANPGNDIQFGQSKPFQFLSIGALLMGAMKDISDLITTITDKLIHGVAYKMAETDSKILTNVKEKTEEEMNAYQQQLQTKMNTIDTNSSDSDAAKQASSDANNISTQSSLEKTKRDSETANPETNLNTDMQTISANAQYAAQQTSIIGKMSNLFDYVSNLLSH